MHKLYFFRFFWKIFLIEPNCKILTISAFKLELLLHWITILKGYLFIFSFLCSYFRICDCSTCLSVGTSHARVHMTGSIDYGCLNSVVTAHFHSDVAFWAQQKYIQEKWRELILVFAISTLNYVYFFYRLVNIFFVFLYSI